MTRPRLAIPLLLATLWAAAAAGTDDTAVPITSHPSETPWAEEPAPTYDTATRFLARQDGLDVQTVHTLYPDPIDELQRRADDDRRLDTANTFTLPPERLPPDASAR